jgi:hypothetical protein
MSKIFGNAHMQETGIHFMGANLKETEEKTNCASTEDTTVVADRFLDIENNLNANNKKLQATGYTIIYKPYPRNPYRPVTVTKSGLVMSGDLFAGEYKSTDSGEIEKAEQFIACGKAISCGPECKCVMEGDDFYYRNVGVPVPFNGQGYYAISEGNVICRVLNNE